MARSKTKTVAKKPPEKKRKSPTKPFTAKFNASQVKDRARKVFEFLKKNGLSTIKEIGDGVFARERPAAKRTSWVRNQLRVLRGWKAVHHVARKGKEPAKYSTACSALPDEAFMKVAKKDAEA